MPEELVIIDLEGFYHFPWGRGKLCSKSDKYKAAQSAESLRELFPGTDFGNLPLPKESTQATQAFKASGLELKENDDVPKPNGKLLTPRETNENATNGNEKLDQEKDKSLGHISVEETAKNEDVVEGGGGLVTSPSVIAGNDSGIRTGKEHTAANDSKSRHEELITDSLKPGQQSTEDTAESCNKNDNPDNKYDIYKHGCSEVLIPKYEFVKKEVTPEQRSIASRTLLSLRRSDDAALDDIRIFNAQDNFVVNSCTIHVELRDTANKELSSDDIKLMETDEALVQQPDEINNGADSITTMIDKTESEQVSSVVEEATDLRNAGKDTSVDGSQNCQSEAAVKLGKSKESILGPLLLEKEKVKEIRRRLQQILPFQVSC